MHLSYIGSNLLLLGFILYCHFYELLINFIIILWKLLQIITFLDWVYFWLIQTDKLLSQLFTFFTVNWLVFKKHDRWMRILSFSYECILSYLLINLFFLFSLILYLKFLIIIISIIVLHYLLFDFSIYRYFIWIITSL
jgi:hypothetical protein